MKLTAALLFICCFQVNARGYGQGVTLNVSNMPLPDVLAQIQKQSGFHFFYNQKDLQGASKVTLNIHQASIEDALKACLANQPVPFDFTVDGHTVNVFKREEKPVKESAGPPDQGTSPDPKKNIHIKITDSTGTPLSGAFVQVEGTKKVATSDDNGEAEIGSIDGNAILIISFVGYGTKRVALDNKSEVGIILRVTNKEMAQVTVDYNTGFQKIPRERATGSFAFVDNKLFNKRVSPDVLSRLEGNVPDLLFNRNTASGSAGVDINIRGHSTLFSNDQPLIVLDNFPYDGDVNNINPNDIETVTILKDAAAASIWGVRSGNGVIVITTKRGRANQKLKVEFNANVTVGQKPNLKYNPNFLDANDYINVEDSLFTQGFFDPALNYVPIPGIVSPVVQLLADARAGGITQADAVSQINALRNIDVRNGLRKYFYQSSLNQQYAVNLTGGGNNSDFILSLGLDNNRASQKGNNNQRVTLNSSYNYYPVKNLIFTAGINYVANSGYTNSPLNTINSAGLGTIYPYATFTDNAGNPTALPKDYNHSWITNPTAQTGLLNWQYVPLNELRYADNTNRSTDNRIVLGLKYLLVKGLSAEIKYQYEKLSTIGTNYYSDSTYTARNLINLYTNLTGAVVNPVPIGGILNKSNGYLTSNHARAQITYNTRIKQYHEVAAIVGSEISSAVNSSNTSTTYGYDKNTATFQNVDFVDYFPMLNGNYALIPSGLSFTEMTNRFVSYFGNASYTFDSRYTVSASGRIDKSNLFGVSTNQKSVPLYSIGVGWDMSKERFYKVDWLPYSKIRATYGYTANINTTATGVPTITQTSVSYYQGTPYAAIASPGNPELRWEKTRMINFGYDFSFKNQAVYGTIEYYLKNASDLFSSAPLAPSTGLSSFFGNTASTKGNGYDLTVTSKNWVSKNFTWTTSFIISHILDKVTRYDVPSDPGTYLANGAGNTGAIYPLTGKPLFAIYSFHSGPLTHDTGDPQGYINGKLSTDYSTIIENTKVDSMAYNGPARPTIFGSFRNTFTYKQLSLSVNIIYKLGYYFRRSSIFYNSMFNLGQGNKDFVNRWKKPGDEALTNVPSLQYPPGTSNRDLFYSESESLVDKGDHIKLQDITLSYELTKTQMGHLPFSSLSIYSYVFANMLIWKANHDRLDPDVFSFGSTSALPIPKTISLGIKATF